MRSATCLVIHPGLALSKPPSGVSLPPLGIQVGFVALLRKPSTVPLNKSKTFSCSSVAWSHHVF